MGHETKTADLYAEGFSPAMVDADFAQFDDAKMPQDVLAEQARVEWSDAMILIFPYWWWSLPAMLKGWIDRVFSYGWAWVDAAAPEKSPLPPRPILVLCSAGATQAQIAKRGYDVAFRTQLETGTINYWGTRDVTLKMLYNINDDTPKEQISKAFDDAVEAATAFAQTRFG